MQAYHDMIREVLSFGTRKENRTGVDTISTFNYNYELCWDESMYGRKRLVQPHVERRFVVDRPEAGSGYALPLLTTKDISWKNIVAEMLWFLSGSANVQTLRRHGCRFWDPWVDQWGHVGPVYGKQWRRWESLHFQAPQVFDPPDVRKSHWRPKQVAGVGVYVRGDRESLPFGELLYNTWAEMLYRCYDEKREHYQWYGAKGVHVDPRWFDFRSFVEDAQRLPGWHLKRTFPDRYSLDKDIANSNRYGLNTCVWASKKEQALNTTMTKLVTVTRPDGAEFSTLDIAGMCGDYNLDRSSVHKCLRGERSEYNGWRFRLSDVPEGARPRVRIYDQVEDVIATLKTNPMSRQVMLTAWNPAEVHLMRLPPCHLLAAFNVQNMEINGHVEPRLCLHLTQRSADLALGVPYNMASYGLLLLILSRLTGIKPGIFAHSLIDLHIYTGKPDGSMAEYDHLPGLKEQLERSTRPLPRLVIDPSIKELSDIEALMDPSVSTEVILEKFKLVDYNPHPAIKFKVAV